MKISTPGGDVSAEWTGDGDTVLVLAHGAGGTLHTPQLVSLARALATRGISVMRFNFNYAEAGKRAPDRTAVVEACWRAILPEARARAKRLFVGGRSMGGRIASHVVAQGEPCDGLVFLAYPLHAPATPEKLRDEHLYTIDAPMLFVQGTRDAFAKPDLFAGVIERLGARATVHAIEGGDHSHKVKGRTAADVEVEIVSAITAFIGGVA